jgi:hypothetical protein
VYTVEPVAPASAAPLPQLPTLTSGETSPLASPRAMSTVGILSPSSPTRSKSNVVGRKMQAVMAQTKVKLQLPDVYTTDGGDGTTTETARGATATPAASAGDRIRKALRSPSSGDGGAAAAGVKHKSCVLMVSIPYYQLCRMQRVFRGAQYAKAVHWTDELDESNIRAAAVMASTEAYLRDVGRELLERHEMAVVPRYSAAPAHAAGHRHHRGHKK